MTKDKSPDDRQVIESEKQMLHGRSTETKTRMTEEKLNSQCSSYKYSAGTIEIMHCPLNQLKKESVKTVISEEKKKVYTSPNTSRITASEVSENTKELKEAKNNKSCIHIHERLASQSAEVKRASSSEKSSKNQLCFPKHLVTVQIPKLCSSKPQIIQPPTMKSQISDNKQSGKVPSSSTLQIQVSSSSEKNQMCLSKPVITKGSPGQVFSTQTTLATAISRHQAGSLSFTPITTVPVRSGLRLLSIISTDSSPTGTVSPDTCRVKTLTTKDGLFISPGNIPKPTTTAQSTITTPQSPTLKAGIHHKLPSTTPETQTTVVVTSPSSTPQSPTVKYQIGTSMLHSTTPQKPSSIGFSNAVVITPQTPTMKDVAGTLRSHITTPQAPTTGVTATIPNSQISTASSVCSSQTTPPLKENESPRTAQSEPTFKAWIPPPDVDPMSQTFLRMPFTYQSLQVQSNHGSRPHVKRPMNAFMVWAKKNRSSIAKRYNTQLFSLV